MRRFFAWSLAGALLFTVAVLVVSECLLRSAFDEKAYVQALSSKEVRDEVIHAILEELSLEDGERTTFQNALEKSLPSETLASYASEIIKGLRHYVVSKGYATITIDISSVKETLIYNLPPEIASGLKSIPDRLDLANYFTEGSLEALLDAYRLLVSIPKLCVTAAILECSILALQLSAADSFRVTGYSVLAGGALGMASLFRFHEKTVFVPSFLPEQLVQHAARYSKPDVTYALMAIALGVIFVLLSRNLPEEKTIFLILRNALSRMPKPSIPKYTKIARSSDKELFDELKPIGKKERTLRTIAWMVLAASSVALGAFCFNQSHFVDYGTMLQGYSQDLKVFSDATGFSGDSAYRYLRELLQNYPVRFAGSEGAKDSAYWIKRQFESLGLDADLESFTAVYPKRRTQDLTSLTPWAERIADFTSTADGYNVVATSPGESQESIVIGAHRDAAGYVEGALDNASGTAVMLELARVLSQTPHHYTFVFVSFDAEELGLDGSEAFCEAHRDLQIRLMVNLDMTGFRNADCVGIYGPRTACGSSPIWTIALADRISNQMFGRNINMFGRNVESSNPIVLFWTARREFLAGWVPTDSQQFLIRDIPAIGFMDWQSSGDSSQSRPIHSDMDNISQVSARALEICGSFAERYIRSVELNEFSGKLENRNYLLLPTAAVPPKYVELFTAGCIALVSATLILSYRMGLDLAWWLRRETPWVLACIILASTSASFVYLFHSEWAREFSFFKLHAAWFVLSVGGTLALTWARQKTQGSGITKALAPYHKFLLNLCYSLTFVFLTLQVNVFSALNAVLLPIILFGRMELSNDEIRTVSTLALAAWTVYRFVNSSSFFKPLAYGPVTPEHFAHMFSSIFLWSVTCMYTLRLTRPSASYAYGTKQPMENRQTLQKT